MRIQILTYYRSLGMIAQMNILMCGLFGLIIIIFVALQVSNIRNVTSTFTNASENLIQISNNVGISNRLQRLVRVSLQLLNMNARRVQSLNLLYNKSFDNTGTNYTSEAVSIGNQNPSYYNYEYLQYYPFGAQIGTDVYNLQFVNFTAIINTLIFELDMTNLFISNSIMILHNSSAQLYSQYPVPSPPIPVYHPLERPWYTKFVDYRQNYGLDLWMSPLFRKFDPPSYTVGIQSSLLHEGFQGITQCALDFSQLQKLISVTSDNIIFLYEDGTILFQNAFTNYTLLNETFYIFNESLTGFSLTQWNQLKYISQKSKYDNIISIQSDHDIKHTQIQQSSILSFDVIIIFILSFSNMEDFCAAAKLSKSVVDEMHSSQIIEMILLVSLDLALLVIVSIVFIFLLYPIKYIEWLIYNNHKLNQTNTMFLARNSNNQLLKLKFNLIKMIMRMRQSKLIKSNICKQFELYKFPKQQELQIPISTEMIINLNLAQIAQSSLRNLIKFKE